MTPSASGPGPVAVLRAPRRVEITMLAPPPLVPGSVLVAVDRCGIGGPDLEVWATGDSPSPAWFGHEWVGRIAAVGAGVTGRFVGERVVGGTCPPCGRCRTCQAGLAPSCEVALSMILGTDPLASPHGAFARHIRVDARRVHRVPDGLDDDAAALSEPAATAAHAVARAGQQLGDLVAVVGAGTIGLLVSELARLAGATRVVAIDPEPGRRELACSLGADAAFGTGPGLERWLTGQGHGLGADVVYECAGHSDAVVSAIAAARPGGTVVLVGVSSRAAAFAPAEVVGKELTLRAALGYTVADVQRALTLMADDRVRVDALYDRVIGFDGLSRAFEQLWSAPSSPRKVLFAPT